MSICSPISGPFSSPASYFLNPSIDYQKGAQSCCLSLFFFFWFFFWWWATPPHSCSRHRDCRPWKTAAKCLVLWLVFCSGVVVVVVIRQVPKRKGNTAVSHSGHFFPPTHVDPYPQACISLAQISCTFPDPTLHTDRYTLLPLNLDKIAFDNGGGGVFIRRIIDLAHRHRS